MNGRQVDDFLQLVPRDAEIECVTGVDFHLRQRPLRRESRDRDELAGLRVEHFPAPHISQRVFQRRVREKGKVFFECIQRRLTGTA